MCRSTEKDIVRRVLALHHAGEIEGLTFSGGEPMKQASSVLGLIERLREADATPPLTFGMFTGYTVGELDQGRYFTFNECPEKTMVWEQIRDRLDFAVMGRYNRFAPGTQPLRSSRNQKLHLFTARYEASDFDEQNVEVSIDENRHGDNNRLPCPRMPRITFPYNSRQTEKRRSSAGLSRPVIAQFLP